jgi:sec-independent protein translocase protein TatA
MLGTQDLLVGLVLAAFFFGAKRLPEIARSLGQSMTEFKKAVAGGGDDHRAPGEATAVLPASASTLPATRPCATCETALEPDWTHCPRCGTAISSTPPMSEAR